MLETFTKVSFLYFSSVFESHFDHKFCPNAPETDFLLTLCQYYLEYEKNLSLLIFSLNVSKKMLIFSNKSYFFHFSTISAPILPLKLHPYSIFFHWNHQTLLKLCILHEKFVFLWIYHNKKSTKTNGNSYFWKKRHYFGYKKMP